MAAVDAMRILRIDVDRILEVQEYQLDQMTSEFSLKRLTGVS